MLDCNDLLLTIVMFKGGGDGFFFITREATSRLQTLHNSIERNWLETGKKGNGEGAKNQI